MGWYVCIKTIKGHRYRYRQRTWREGKHVRCESIYLGPADGENGDTRGSRRGESIAVPIAPVAASSSTRRVNTTMRARDVPLVDAVAEKAVIDRIFSVAEISGWERPWIGGRFTAEAKWMPDQRLYALSEKIGVVGKSSPFGGTVDLGWRKKRYEIKAAYNSRNVLEIPDHTRFRASANATAEQHFAHTFLHEMAHATGLKLECKRAIWNRFGSSAYAREEMVADLTAYIMAHRLGLAPVSLAGVTWYIDNWSRAIKYEHRAEARAYAEREALRAADYLTKLWGEVSSKRSASVNTTN